MKARDTVSILRATRLYYKENLSQDEIAKKLGTSRSNVSRMLADARRLGFIEIKIVEPSAKLEPVSTQLQNLLSIKDVQVIVPQPNELTVTTVGRAAARAILRAIKPNNTIAISWGRGIEAAVMNIRNEKIPGLKVTQLMGCLSSPVSTVGAEELGRTLARNLNAQFFPLLAPAVVSSSKTASTMMNEASIAEVLEIAKGADVALVGIGSNGSVSSEEVLRQFRLPQAAQAKISTSYAGDISARFYNEKGAPLNRTLDSRVVGLTLSEIKKIPRVIGIATGAEKARGVIAAARSGIIKTLILDTSCAAHIMLTYNPAKESNA